MNNVYPIKEKNIMQCNICEGTAFENMGIRKNVRCSTCNSLERTRLMWMYLQRLDLSSNAKILHIAPEKGLSKKLRAVVGSGYVSADLNPIRYPWADNCVPIDLCNLDAWPTKQFDLILHSHVLEHTTCNIAYTLWHLHRMLNDNGTHLAVIPFESGFSDETFKDIGDTERTRRFGQHDHVRKFGVSDVDRCLGKLLNLSKHIDAATIFSSNELDQANIPISHRTGLNMSTVLLFHRTDMLLLGSLTDCS
jgi:hypothetical protein